jgi:S1-C subfamily serine protease
MTRPRKMISLPVLFLWTIINLQLISTLQVSRRARQYHPTSSLITLSDTAATTEIPSSASTSLFWPPRETKKGKRNENDDDQEEEQEDFYQQVFDSIIKIYATHSDPDFIMPWQKKHPTSSTSSGFVIEGNRIMTNAHSVEYATMIQIQRRGDSTKYKARVQVIVNDCDLAILDVLDEDNNGKASEFWESLSAPLEFGTLPQLQDEVEVLGYPQGGSGLSITSGVVSRVELQEYAQSGMHLLAIQIDAAINSGNSGGPVVDAEGKVVGVAFQILERAENIGYVVPVTVVQHVLEDIRRNGQYSGFCCLGASFVDLENQDARDFLQLQDQKGGIMIRHCSPTCFAKEYLQPDDVVLEVDGIQIAQDGNVPFRPGERVSLLSYIQTKFLGDSLSLVIWRREDGESTPRRQSIDVPLSPSFSLVPKHWDNRPPPYLVMAGLIFSPLSVPYLEACNAWDEYVSDPISHLVGQIRKPQENEGDQIVILVQVMAHPLNLGYDQFCDLQLSTFNDVKVRSLRHLHQLIQECLDDYVRLEFMPSGNLVILKRETIQTVTDQVCQAHSIQTPYYNAI